MTALVTAAMLEPIVDGITANVAVILPVGVAIMGIMVSVGMIPRILQKFV